MLTNTQYRYEGATMFRKSLGILISVAFAISLAAATDNPVPQAQLSAAEIVNKNVVARGGLQAWRAVQTMSMSGNMGVGGNQRTTLPLSIPGGHKLAPGFVPPRPAQEVELPSSFRPWYKAQPRAG